MTNSQIDRLGERLKTGPVQEKDLRLLDEYRASFAPAYDHVVGVIRNRPGLAPTGRRVKTTASIIAKIQRERSRLSQIQDIAGCRIVLNDPNAQNHLASALQQVFPGARVVDRREQPSHGYRAVHLIVRSHGKFVEIQVRTFLQHLWAELSEKLSDAVDPAIKYGGGPERIRADLAETAELIRQIEQLRDMPGYDAVRSTLETHLQRMITHYQTRGQ